MCLSYYAAFCNFSVTVYFVFIIVSFNAYHISPADELLIPAKVSFYARHIGGDDGGAPPLFLVSFVRY